MRSGTALLLAALFFLFAPAAEARLPKPGKVLPGRSMGPVRLGMDPDRARAAWGNGGSCDSMPTVTPGSRCRWEGANGAYAEFVVADRATGGGPRHGKVAQIAIGVNNPDGPLVFTRPITRWKTSRGIGIGSRMSRVRRAYDTMLSAAGEDLFSCRRRSERITQFIESPGQGRQEAQDELEQDPGGDQEHRDGQSLGAEVRSGFTHVPSMP
jgi:hypothetical protein